MQNPARPDTSLLAIARWAAPYAAHRWRGLLLVLGTMLLRIGFDVLKPWPMKVIADNVLEHKPMPPWLQRGLDLPGLLSPRSAAEATGASVAQHLLLLCVAATVLFFVGSSALSLANNLANVSFSQRIVYDVAADLFAHIQRLSLRFHTSSSVGDLIRRVTGDCSCIATIVRDGALSLTSSLLSLLIMFGIMWRLSPPLTLMSLAVLPLIALALKLYMRPMQDRAYVQQQCEGKIYEVMEQTLSAVTIVQAFDAQDREQARFREATGRTLAASLSLARVQLQFKVLLGFATALGTAGILWLGTRQALAGGGVSVGDLIVFLAYLGSLYAPIEAMMYSPATIQAAGGSARRVLEVLQHDHAVRDLPNAHPLPRARGQMQLSHVSFGYQANCPVLHDVSLQVGPGETLAIVGPTGAGKSTLAGLLLRFFDPWSGKVLLDGHDLRDLPLADVRRQVSLVLQDPFLFPRSIAENIAYGRPGATQDAIEAAAKAANAHDFILQLPQGYQTVLGERGATLSGGQRQRLSIARALLRDAPVLILDEPTSALDAQTEALLLQAVERLMAGRTTFIIAHRLSTIRNASQIVVLDHGRIVQAGSHKDLIQQLGLYARLHALQSVSTPA